MNIHRAQLTVLSVLFVSSSHLTAEEGTGGLEEHAPPGIYATVSDDENFEVKLWDDPSPASLTSKPPSDGLAAIVAIAKAHGIERIRFSAEAPRIPGVPVYHW